jgi:hypothetical protein
MQKEAPQNEASYFSHGLRESGLSFFARLQYLLGPKCVGPKSNFWRHGLSLIFAIHAAFLGGVDDDQR